MHRTLIRALGALALVAALALPGLAGAQEPAPQGTPVLGASLLTPAQITAWYASTGIVSKSPTPVAELASRFVDEGAAQGVRGDIAFAQSMLETGYLRYGGIVKPSDLNFSGLGACDSCPRGLAFPSAELGVRAQIQHLYAYAAPGADPNVLARPLADIRFTNVRPYGKAPLWEQMGNGNWATGTGYAEKVLGIWRQMLAYSGIPVPAPQGAGGTPDLTVLASPNGAARLSGWRPRQTPLADGIAALGAPSSMTPSGKVCLVRWDTLGAAVLVGGAAGDPCTAGTARMRWSRLDGSGWRTNRDLKPGDSLARMRALYPKARPLNRTGRSWGLVTGRDKGKKTPVPRLRAEVRNGAVKALWVHPATT